VSEGFIKVIDWWKSVELIELIKEAAYSGQWRMLDNLYNNEYQQACSDLKEFLNGSIINSAASPGQIDALEWAWDQGTHGGAESCMIAAREGCSHVLQWLRENGATWNNGVISVLRKVGMIMLWNGLERMAVLNHKLDQMLLCTGAWAGHQ
jgi:hypothetical protein